MSKKLCQRFIILFGLLFLLACSVLVLPDSQRAAKLGDECAACNAGCNDDYNECLNIGEKPWRCNQWRMACFNFCQTEFCS